MTCQLAVRNLTLGEAAHVGTGFMLPNKPGSLICLHKACRIAVLLMHEASCLTHVQALTVHLYCNALHMLPERFVPYNINKLAFKHTVSVRRKSLFEQNLLQKLHKVSELPESLNIRSPLQRTIFQCFCTCA